MASATEFTVILGDREVKIELTRRRMKNIRLRVSPDGEVKASAPLLAPKSVIKSFILSKQQWICSCLEQSKKRVHVYPTHIEQGTRVLLLGREYTVRLERGKKSSVLSGSEVVLTNARESSPAALQKQYDDFVKSLALPYFTECCKKLFHSFELRGIRFPQLSVSKMKSRWGSCNFKDGKINFSLYLYGAPEQCCEYVAAHELCHLVHSGHQTDFYALLCRLMPDWKQRKNLLRKLSGELMP